MADYEKALGQSIEDVSEHLSDFLKEITDPAFIPIERIELVVARRAGEIVDDKSNMPGIPKQLSIRTPLKEAFAARDIPYRAVGNLKGFVNPAMADAFALPGAKKKDLRDLRHELLADGKVQRLPFFPGPEEPS